MIKKQTILALLIIANITQAFSQNFKIRQSMETAEQRQEPAQFQVTFPKNADASWLVNVGASLAIKTNSTSFLSKLSGEYHKNTLTEKKQNNLNIGYGYTWLIGGKKLLWFSTGDAKYVYDEIKKKSSIASNILFTFYRDGSKLNWNTYTISKNARSSLFLSLFAGTQLQQIFQAKNDSAEGFILRPLFNAMMNYDFNRKRDSVAVVRLGVNYIGRKDAVNTTKYNEGYTNFFKAYLDYFFVYTAAIKVSLGVSFNYGSDPMRGLDKQQYWLLSLNLIK